MQQRYPEPVGPKTEKELMAWLFGLLHGAYSMLAQYEEDVKRAEAQQIRDMFSKGGRDDDSESTGPHAL